MPRTLVVHHLKNRIHWVRLVHRCLKGRKRLRLHVRVRRCIPLQTLVLIEFNHANGWVVSFSQVVESSVLYCQRPLFGMLTQCSTTDCGNVEVVSSVPIQYDDATLGEVEVVIGD